MSLHMLLYVFAFVCFILGAMNVTMPPRLNIVSLGLALFTLTFLI